MLNSKLNKILDNFVVFIQLHKIDNHVNSIEIEKKFNIKGSEVRQLINNCRNLGMPIANTIKTEDKIIKCYFWADSWDEFIPTINDLENRRNELSKIIANLKKYFNQYDSPTLF